MITSKQIKQIALLLLILVAAVLVLTQLFPFMPGLLGAVTLYILLREWFFKLTVVYNWKKWVAAITFIVGSIVVFVIPIVLIALLTYPKLSAIALNPNFITDGITHLTTQIQLVFPRFSLTETQVTDWIQQGLSSIPGYFGATIQVITNILLCFFLLYFMLISGRKMERRIQHFIALKNENIDEIWLKTRLMVVSNAIGIPLLAVVQGIAAIIGYWIFGVDGAIVWGLLTGLFSILPIIGTAIVWIPLIAYYFALGKTGMAFGLLIYTQIVTVNIDNVFRITLLKKFGDVHPVITVLGIIIGVPLFGFMGLIFGPLILSYFLLLIHVYQVEFTEHPKNREFDIN